MLAASALLVTRDETLLDEMLRLAAAAGVVLDVAHDSAAALRSWSSAALVLVGHDQVAAVASHQPVRRNEVHVVVHGTAPPELFRAALALGAEDVVELPAADSWVVELLTDLSDGGSRTSLTLGVVGGSGGAGATTFAAALAVTAAATGEPTVLIDGDPLGGGIDRVIGLDDHDGLDWDGLGRSGGRLSSRSLREALPRRQALGVLTWSAAPVDLPEPAAVREVLCAAQRGHEVVVVDLPRHLGPVGAELLPRCDHVVLVVALTVPAVAAAARVADQVGEVCRDVHLVARGRSAAVDPEDAARALGLPLLTTMGNQRRLAECVDLGLGPVHARRGPLARAAREVLDSLPHRVRAA